MAQLRENPRESRRTRIYADLTTDSEAAFRSLVRRYFHDTPADAVRAAISILAWLVRAREAGNRVIAVSPDDVPARFEEPVITGLEELLEPAWTWLVARPHPWRRQLWIKGRKIAAGDLARTAEIEGWSADETATQFDLPIDAVREAVSYLATHRELVLAEERENRLAMQAAVGQPTPVG